MPVPDPVILVIREWLLKADNDLKAGAHTLTLPDNDKIRVMAISVAETNPQVKPAQPLYDVLPSNATTSVETAP